MSDKRIEITIQTINSFSVEFDSPILDDIYKLTKTDEFELASVTEYQLLNYWDKCKWFDPRYRFESIGVEGTEAIRKIIAFMPDKDIVFLFHGRRYCHEFSKDTIFQRFHEFNIPE